MATVNEIRDDLIAKILTINNKKILMALDILLNSTADSNGDAIKLSEAQKAILNESQQDIHEGQFISQEDMDQRNLKWLSEL